MGIELPNSPTKRPMNVTYYYDAGSQTGASMGTSDSGATLTLSVNLAQVIDGSGNLKSEGILDTLIAHEVVHALEFTEMSYIFDAPQGAIDENWFTEGLAMVIQGGNLFAVTDHNVNLINPFDGDYRSAYEAVKAIHEITNGGIAAFIDELELGRTLNQAFQNTTQQFGASELNGAAGGGDFTSVSDFITWFNTNASSDVTDYISSSTDFSTGSGAITLGTVKGSSSNLTLDQTIANGTGTSELNTHFSLNFTNANSSPVDNASTMKFQIGANADQSMSFNRVNITSSALLVNTLDLMSQTAASSALGSIDSAIEVVSASRSYFGALQNRLELSIKNLDTSSENLQASESRIRDVDMAKEMMNFTKNNIFQQAAQAMLAQANAAPQGILQLLR